MPEEEPKKFERRKLISDFTMGQQDFERFDKLLTNIDEEYRFLLYFQDEKYMRALYADLNNIIDEWSAIMIESALKDVDNAMEQLEIEMANINYSSSSSVAIDLMKQEAFNNAKKLIKNIRRILMKERQTAGFGIKTSRQESDRAIFKRAIEI